MKNKKKTMRTMLPSKRAKAARIAFKREIANRGNGFREVVVDHDAKVARAMSFLDAARESTACQICGQVGGIDWYRNDGSKARYQEGAETHGTPVWKLKIHIVNRAALCGPCWKFKFVPPGYKKRSPNQVKAGIFFKRAREEKAPQKAAMYWRMHFKFAALAQAEILQDEKEDDLEIKKGETYAED